jgi:hypothetical protein
MELKDFVESALVSIVRGIQSAQRVEGCGGLIAPDAIGGHDFPTESGVYHSARIVSTTVKFDVAVTAGTTVSGSGGGKAKILVANASVDGKLEHNRETVSRVQFSVPVLMPTNPREWHTETGEPSNA